MKKPVFMWMLAAMLLCAGMMPLRAEAAVSQDDYRAVWFSYYDYESYLKANPSNTQATFTRYFNKVLNKCKSRGFNRIIVQVRPSADAMYDSDIFPTSKFIAKKQGRKLSYDPLKIMVAQAHKKGLKIEAWINPYRVSFDTKYSSLAKNNPARKWHESSNKADRRNVLSYGGKLYFNPSSKAVRNLIVAGVKEIVRNYDVDGIHMDDYFYPSFSKKNYKKAFDAKEYNLSAERKRGKDIVSYRRKQVNILLKRIKKAIKAIDPNVVFGVSPAGNINNLTSKYSYYVDIKRWTNSTQYVDYIAPQIYWGFSHRTAGFGKMVSQWSKMVNQDKVKLYIGIPAYKMQQTSLASSKAEKKELKTRTLLVKMLKYCIKKKTDGIIVFDYADINKSSVVELGKYIRKVY